MPHDWFEQGLRFECTQCGACCTGPPGVVRFSEEEGRRIAERLGISYDDFLRDYTHRTAGGVSLNEQLTEHGYDCVFLDRKSLPGKAVCSLYEDRPLQCRTFPFWPEHIRSRRDWETLGRHCEGVNRGDFVPASQVRIQREKQRERNLHDRAS